MPLVADERQVISCFLPLCWVGSPAIWDHTALPATQHRWTCPAITPARQASISFTCPGGMEGWVDLSVGSQTYNISIASPTLWPCRCQTSSILHTSLHMHQLSIIHMWPRYVCFKLSPKSYYFKVWRHVLPITQKVMPIITRNVPTQVSATHASKLWH